MVGWWVVHHDKCCVYAKRRFSQSFRIFEKKLARRCTYLFYKGKSWILQWGKTCSLKSSGGVRQIKILANGSTPQTEEHWGSLHKLRRTTLLYTVHCTLFTVHFFSTQLSHTTFQTIYHIIFQHN